MGRSVSYLRNAIGIAYIHFDNEEQTFCDKCGNANTTTLDEDTDEGHNHLCEDCNITFEGYPTDPQFEWNCFVECIEDILKKRIPSIDILDRKNSRWDDRETRIFAENNLAEFGISEYCGLVSISIRVIEDDYAWKYEALAKHWIAKVWPGIQAAIVETFPTTALCKVGNFSNGEGVYTLAKQAS